MNGRGSVGTVLTLIAATSRLTVFLLLVLAALSVPEHGRAQLASVRLDIYPKSDSPSDGAVTVDGDDIKGRNDENITSLRLDASLPIPLHKHFILLPGAAYQFLRFGGSEADADLTLHAPTVSMGGLVPIGQWLVVTSMSAGYASDFDHALTLDELLLSGAVIVSYSFKRWVTLGLGLGYTRQTGDLGPIPMLGVDVLFTDRVRLHGTAPTEVMFEYHPLRWLTASARAAMDGNRFDLDPKLLRSAFPAGVKPTDEDGKPIDEFELAYSVVDVTAGVTFTPMAGINIDVYAGVATRRRYEFFVNENALDARATIPTGAIAGLRLWIGGSPWPSDAPPKAPSKATDPAPVTAPNQPASTDAKT